tara:strand:+ start:13425 stop:13802 length:378 start_codon:yes stop_codon:yes gene_type:complete
MTYLSRLKQETFYVSANHKIVLIAYFNRLDNALKHLNPNDSSILLLSELIDVAIDYSNSFSEERELFFYEWVRALPLNLTFALGGFVAGIKNNENIELCNMYYREILNAGSDCLDNLSIIRPEKE